MQHPTAQELIEEKFLRAPKSARGVYLDRRPGQDDVHMRFVWESPNKWVWMHAAEPLAGAITDGITNVIVEDGVAVLITDEGKVHTTHRLTNLLRPSLYYFDGFELGPVRASTVIGKSAWCFSATPSIPGKTPHEVVFDADSGVMLCMRTGDSYLGFEELELDEAIPDETFRWAGPVEPRKVGVVYAAQGEDGGFSVHQEVSVRGRPVFDRRGPAGISAEEEVAWGRKRSDKVLIRLADGDYRWAGVGPNPYPEIGVWKPGAQGA